jgi:hypothetical protein
MSLYVYFINHRSQNVGHTQTHTHTHTHSPDIEDPQHFVLWVLKIVILILLTGGRTAYCGIKANSAKVKLEPGLSFVMFRRKRKSEPELIRILVRAKWSKLV